MAASRYNVIVKDAPDETIIFNTLTGALAVLDAQAYATYQTGAGELLGILEDNGFLVAADTDELELQRLNFEHDRFDRSWLALSIAPTLACNYACPYCYQRDLSLNGRMSDEVITGIYTLVEKYYQRDQFKDFSVQWYGGEPALCLDIIEKMSAHFMEFCAARGIAYEASILTNGSLIDADAARRLAASRVTHAMTTVDGCRELHNRRRIARNGEDSFSMTLGGALACKQAGIDVSVAMNLDKQSLSDYHILRRQFDDQDKFDIFPSLMKDYRGDFGCAGFSAPKFDLYTREEYAHIIHDLFLETPYTADVLQRMLAPVRNFCRGQLENYLVIDGNGDIFKCEGWISRVEHRVANVLDDQDLSGSVTTSLNPMDDALCRDCRVLPLCKGQCAWDRSVLENACHVIKFTIEDYVADYRNCFGEAAEPVSVFVAPVPAEEFFARDFCPDQPGESTFAGTLCYHQNDGGVELATTIFS
jgi:uncharacterized protein